MTENTVNIPLLRKAVEWAEAEAAKPWEFCQWNQLTWRSDPALVKKIDPKTWDTIRGFKKSAECGTCFCIAGYIVDSQELDPSGGWSGPAMKALGITERQASHLFDAGNEIEDVRRIAEDIAGERL